MTSLRLCSNTLAQLVIPAALKDMETPTSMIMPGGRIYEQREATVSELEKINGLTFVKNDAAFYIFPKLDIKNFWMDIFRINISFFALIPDKSAYNFHSALGSPCQS